MYQLAGAHPARRPRRLDPDEEEIERAFGTERAIRTREERNERETGERKEQIASADIGQG